MGKDSEYEEAKQSGDVQQMSLIKKKWLSKQWDEMSARIENSSWMTESKGARKNYLTEFELNTRFGPTVAKNIVTPTGSMTRRRAATSSAWNRKCRRSRKAKNGATLRRS
eukprot:2261174-Amphidinium_carterae.2